MTFIFFPNLHLQNTDLLAVGLTVAAIGILGFIVYSSKPKSITNQTFFVLSIIDIFYAIANYLSYQTGDEFVTLWLLRLVIFSAVWYSFILFHLFYVFPKEEQPLPTDYKFVLIPIIVFTSGLTLTKYVFSHIARLAPPGEVSIAGIAPGIIVFGLIITGLTFGGIYLIFKKTLNTSGPERRQFNWILLGTLLTYTLIIIFNFIFPVIFNNTTFIPLAPVMTLPFIIFTAYAIMKYKLLNIKIIATEILTFLLASASLVEVIISHGVGEVIFRIFIFSLILGFGILLIRSVRREVEQREQLQILSAKLAKANEKLKALDKARSEFITMASHQLRTPPVALKWYIAAMLAGDFGPLSADLRDALSKTMMTTNGLISLIDDMLNVSRIERGKMEFVYSETDLAELAQITVDQLQPLATMKKLKLIFEKPQQQLPKLIADKEKIRQVINNLIDNAIKYTQSGRISVNILKKGNNLELRVSDTGKGVDLQEFSKIFEKFGRAKDSKNYSTGLGLGLYLGKVVIEQHQGKIWIESKGVGKGSTFIFSLPIKTNVQPTKIFDLTKSSPSI